MAGLQETIVVENARNVLRLHKALVDGRHDPSDPAVSFKYGEAINRLLTSLLTEEDIEAIQSEP